MHDSETHDGEPHVTETFGVREVTVKVNVHVLRMRPDRSDLDEAGKLHLNEVIIKWAVRYCRRRNLAFDGFHVAAVGGMLGERPDALVVAYRAWEMPVDWMCFGGIVPDTMFEQHRLHSMPIDIAGLVGAMFGEGEEADVAEATVDGKSIPVGTQKRTIS